ncbi:MAG: hypothetical protein H8D46_00685, partial [FCB group bacterium]|nr:hypothetical protein [FCB group bacterium]
GPPVFTTLGGFSSCPWEPSTVPLGGASLQVDPPVQVDVPPDGEAVFTLSLGNLSAVGADRDYDLRVINSSNPDGAVIAINGIILENAISYSIPYGENIETIMTVARGPVAYLYEGLQLQLVSPCEYADGSGAWSDTISVNIEFQTPCSESHIAVPENNWLITSADASDTLWVTVDNFDRFNTNLDRIELQYRQASGFNGGSSDGEDDGEDLIVLSGATGDDDPETDTPQIPGAVKSGTIPLSQDSDDEDPAPRSGDWFVAASVNGADLIDDYVLMPWNISPSIVIDGTYELRSVAVCDAGLTPGTSSIVSGRIDRAAPLVLGAPTPITGILGPDNIISITYNENIECGAISIGAQHITLTNTVTGNPIDFTHTCGGNMIVIEPNIQNHFIENQTLRASVGPIEDLYGNATVNPAMWEFFVNRNPVQWIGTGIENVIIYIDETYSTTRTLFNAGGSNRSFEITNIPAWMTVYPTQGILPPGGAETISFILSNEPGSGQFTDTIYASGVLGDEPMPVDIRVLCHEPSWDLNPGDYQYSMNIIASLTTEGQLSEDIYDFVAVFVGDELRGIESIQYVPELESLPNIHPYQVYLTVFSNSVSGEDLELVVWDASECTLLGQVLETYTFDANEVLGNLAFPETITATNQVIQNIDFTGGWNWFSLNLTPADMSVDSILGDLSPVTNDLIKGQTTYGQFAESYGWLGTLSSLNNHEMYMLHLADPGTLEIVGYPVDIELDTIAVTSGWNWISFTPQQSYDVNDALMHLTSFSGDLIKSQFNFSMYLEGIGWLGNLNFMNPLFGYQLYSQLPGQLYYPLQQELARDVDQQDEIPLTESNSQDWLVNTAAYEENMTLVGRLSSQSGQLYDPDMLVAAFVGDECRGVSRIQYIPELEDYRVFLVIYGSMDESDVAFKVYSPEYDQVLDVQETIAFEGSDIIGSPDAPMTLNAGSGSSNGSLLPSVFALGQNFPNPFNPVTM